MDQQEELKIVGIGGLPRSGKDLLAELFMQSGYFGLSLGEIVRNESRTRHADQPDPISVKNMTETSNYLRQTRGADFALVEALKLFAEAKKTKSYTGLLVWSIRAPVEVDFILSHKGHLIWLETSDEVRHQRAMNMLREGEVEISLDEFKAHEALQWVPQPDLPSEIQMNISYVKEKATDVFENNTDDMNEFKLKANKLITQL